MKRTIVLVYEEDTGGCMTDITENEAALMDRPDD